jgi:L-ribulokinase
VYLISGRLTQLKLLPGMDKYVIGLDYGTDSVRALVVNARNGQEAGSGIWYYKRWKENLYCDPLQNMFRQHPADYIEGLESSVKDALSGLSKEITENISGISVDTTGSTPVAVNENGVPLALLPRFARESQCNVRFVERSYCLKRSSRN